MRSVFRVKHELMVPYRGSRRSLVSQIPIDLTLLDLSLVLGPRKASDVKIKTAGKVLA